MGRLFSYQEIVEGQLPTPEDFAAAAGTFVSLSEAALADGTVDGAFIYGSVALGVANKRSDFDSLIALSSSEPRAYQAARAIVQGVRAEANDRIPVGVITQSRDALASGRHEMDRFFGRHLSSQYRTVVGNDPGPHIRYPDTPASRILASYLASKKRKLGNTYNSAPPLDVRDGSGLQRLLELPASIGRKTLQASAAVGIIDKAVEKSADRRAVYGAARNLLDGTDLLGGFDELVGLDNLYNDLLDETLAGHVTERQYEDELWGLHDELPTALSWLNQYEQHMVPAVQAAEHDISLIRS